MSHYQTILPELPHRFSTPRHLWDNVHVTQTQRNSFQPHVPLLFYKYNTNIFLILTFPKSLRYVKSHFTPLRISNSETLTFHALAHVFPHPPLQPLVSTTRLLNLWWPWYFMSISLQCQKQCLAQHRHPDKSWPTMDREIPRPQVLLRKRFHVLHIQRGHYKSVSHSIHIYWPSFICSEVSCRSLLIEAWTTVVSHSKNI